jgi:dTDP-4-amino-4,6-dideoxygalactose transaminase
MIPFLDVQRMHAAHREALKTALMRVFDSGRYVLGSEVTAFETAYARYIGTDYCVGVANGLDALRLIFRAYMELGELAEGDEVLVPSNTYIASMLAISDNRLVPVPVEPRLSTFQLDEGLLEAALTKKTKAVLLVHLYGQCAYNEALDAFCIKHHLKLIEDNAQAAGACYLPAESPGLPRRTGSLGCAAGHSFYPSKNLGCLGDGGAVTTSDPALADMVRTLANYGSSRKYIFDRKGINSRLDELQAAILHVKLGYLDAENERRRALAQVYLDEVVHPEVRLPGVATNPSNVFHVFPVLTPRRAALQQYLAEKGVETVIHYPIPPHHQEAYKEWKDASYPISERIHREELSLPIGPAMTMEEMRYVAHCITNWK